MADTQNTVNKQVYVSKENLQYVLGLLKAKNETLYLRKGTEAASAAKVKNALTLTVGDTDVVFDGSIAKSAAVAAASHKHAVTDINDFSKEVKKVVFGDENSGIVAAHTHSNLTALEKISDEYITAWNAKIGVNDVEKLKYTNATAMPGVDNVKTAIDILVKNIQINSAVLSDATANVNGLATKLTAAEGKITALENANKEGGAVANAIADAKKAGTDAKDAVDALVGKVGTVPADKTVIGLIGEAKAQADQGVADAAAEVTRATGVENALRADLGQKADPAAAEGSAFARIAQLKADLAAEVTRADTAEKAALKAGQDAQKDVDALEAKVGDAADTKDDATVYGAIAAEKARAMAAEGAVDAKAEANKAAIATLNGADTVEGSVAKKIKDAIDKVNTVAAGLGGRVDTLETKVGSDKDTAAADGSLYARVKQNANEIGAIKADYLKAADKTALENAINDQKDRIDAFYASAEVGDKAIDTLKEIQDYITSDGTAAAQMTKDIAANKTAIDAINNETTGILAKAKKYADDQDAEQKEALEGAIATAKQEAIEAAATAADTKVNNAKTELQGKIDKKADQTALEAEIERAQGAEQANASAIATLNGDVNTNGSVAKAVNEAKTALTTEINKKADTATLNAKVEELKAADTKLSERIAKFEGDGAGSVAAQVKAVADDLKAHKAAQVTKEKAVDDKLAVIQGEANVEGSIKKALADAKKYADDEDAKIEALLGNKDDAKTAETAFGKIAAEAARATAAEEALAGDITGINSDISTIQAQLANLIPLTNSELDAMLNEVYK